MSNNVTADKAPIQIAPKAIPSEARIEAMKAIAQPARLKWRHYIVVFSFLLFVLVPFTITGGYLYTVAKDQYASYAGFSIRKEEVGSAIDLLGGLAAISGNSSSDTDILFAFIQSRQMIRAVEEEIDLQNIYKVEGDPVFSLKTDASIEELQRYWNRIVKVFYDTSTGMIEIRVVAFKPADAQRIATIILEESTRMINAVSTVAREDVIGYARTELDDAYSRLRESRLALTDFRVRTQIVDPLADTQGRMGLLNTLQNQLASALIELDMITRSTANDPRVDQGTRRVQVIEERIAAERDKLGGTNSAQAYSAILAEYEVLAVDQKFAESSYLAALAAYHATVAEAQHKSRYLATYISPTLAETPEYPQRLILLALMGGFLMLCWSILILIYYSIRDRR